jgi:hypothetical protein
MTTHVPTSKPIQRIITVLAAIAMLAGCAPSTGTGPGAGEGPAGKADGERTLPELEFEVIATDFADEVQIRGEGPDGEPYIDVVAARDRWVFEMEVTLHKESQMTLVARHNLVSGETESSDVAEAEMDPTQRATMEAFRGFILSGTGRGDDLEPLYRLALDAIDAAYDDGASCHQVRRKCSHLTVADPLFSTPTSKFDALLHCIAGKILGCGNSTAPWPSDPPPDAPPHVACSGDAEAAIRDSLDHYGRSVDEAYRDAGEKLADMGVLPSAPRDDLRGFFILSEWIHFEHGGSDWSLAWPIIWDANGKPQLNGSAVAFFRDVRTGFCDGEEMQYPLAAYCDVPVRWAAATSPIQRLSEQRALFDTLADHGAVRGDFYSERVYVGNGGDSVHLRPYVYDAPQLTDAGRWYVGVDDAGRLQFEHEGPWNVRESVGGCDALGLEDPIEAAGPLTVADGLDEQGRLRVFDENEDVALCLWRIDTSAVAETQVAARIGDCDGPGQVLFDERTIVDGITRGAVSEASPLTPAGQAVLLRALRDLDSALWSPFR